MPLPLAEIRNRAIRFAHDWHDGRDEIAEAQTFLNDFFSVFGIARRRFAAFESRVTHADGRRGRIDLLWKGVLLVEMKSRGADLERAYEQARDYFPALADHDLPRFVLVCDFDRFRLYDLDTGRCDDFALAQLPARIELFGFISGWQVRHYEPEAPVNAAAAQRMGELHDALDDQGYHGHELEVLLVRLVFCLFAEDTGIFDTAAFREFLQSRTAPDGTNLGPQLNELFEILNTPEDVRQLNLTEDLRAFPYVNGGLFEERLRAAAFSAAMREALLGAASLDWGEISPAIFGALFQSIMDTALRRRLGAHYTSEVNILNPDIPTFSEAGLPLAALDPGTWWGVIAPAKLPIPIQAQLAKAMGEALADPELQKRVASMSIDIIPGTGQEFATLMSEERRKWADVVVRAKIEVE